MNAHQCVLIADVIHSSRKGSLRALLADRLRRTTEAHLREKRIRVPYAVTAGDEFQVVAASLEGVPELILDLRRRMRPLGLRIGIGIGGIRGSVKAPVNRLVGEAFTRARQAIEAVKQGSLYRYPTLTSFRSARERFDRMANLVYGLNDTLFLSVTEAQWRTMEAYFQKRRVDRAAKRLRLDISTASRSLKRGHYWQLAEVAGTMKVFFRDEWI
jgi:SatD family (SatD)